MSAIVECWLAETYLLILLSPISIIGRWYFQYWFPWVIELGWITIVDYSEKYCAIWGFQSTLEWRKTMWRPKKKHPEIWLVPYISYISSCSEVMIFPCDPSRSPVRSPWEISTAPRCRLTRRRLREAPPSCQEPDLGCGFNVSSHFYC